MLALPRTYAAKFYQFRPIDDRVTHDVSCIRIRTPSWRHSLEALTYYVYALCFCTRQNARETIAWPMISGSRAALLNRIPIVKLAKSYVR